MVAAGTPRLVLLDSVTQVEPQHAGCIVVTGSHGGASVVRYARAVDALLYVFNDAGIGRDDAGVAALPALELAGIAAATVSHMTARIGEARDSWEHGVVSRANAQAALLGLHVGLPLRAALKATHSEIVDLRKSAASLHDGNERVSAAKAGDS